ncbi:MAG: N-acetylmuramoyl-L-alanine amidase [Bacteroidetes bacterium]|nr:N-acetylmuramoyl-L-alanine amidase [Bacteroidota bacterium]
MNKIAFIIILTVALCKGQTIKQCKERFNNYLNFKGGLNNIVKFEDNEISICNFKGNKEFTIYAGEINMLADFLEHTPYKQQEELLRLKGTKKYSKRQRDSVWIYIDDRKKIPKGKKKLPLNGYRVAIDPGHFGTNLEDAQIEQKFLYFIKDSVNLPTDTIKLFESELNFNTAQLLQKMLEELGATVFLTRNQNNYTSFNCSFKDWLLLHKNRVLDSLKSVDFLGSERYNKLIKEEPAKFFKDFFRDYDLANRAKKINQFKPHVSVIIHYNVDEKNAPWKKMSDKDYTMAFIGGAFTHDNMERTETKLHFLRMLLTKQLNQSEKLAAQTVLNFNKNLKIDIATQFDAEYLKDNCLITESKGVFARNLLLCRIINSPLVYGEALYQDSYKECSDLMRYDTEKYGIKTSDRLLKTAESYFQALVPFLKGL